MTYSNTKKDKIQLEIWKRLRDITLTGVMIGILITTTSGFYHQWKALTRANDRNQQLAVEIARLEKENRILERQIAEASEPAFIERKMRDFFGIGSPNDYWLKLPEMEVQPGEKVVEEAGDNDLNVMRWWKMFR